MLQEHHAITQVEAFAADADEDFSKQFSHFSSSSSRKIAV
jgi:hypothetical protein